MDNKYVKIGMSDYNDGAFAKRDIKAGTVFALYGGQVLTRSAVNHRSQEFQLKLKKLNESGKYTEDELLTIHEKSWMYR